MNQCLAYKMLFANLYLLYTRYDFYQVSYYRNKFINPLFIIQYISQITYRARLINGSQNEGIDLSIICRRCALMISVTASFGEVSEKMPEYLEEKENANTFCRFENRVLFTFAFVNAYARSAHYCYHKLALFSASCRVQYLPCRERS